MPVFKLFWLLLCVLVLEGCGQRQGGQTPESPNQETLSYKIGDAGVTITNCDGAAAGEVVIPDEIEGLPVTSLGDSAFIGCTSLTSIIIPESVTRIEDFAFSGCRSLTSATIPDKVTSIGNYAFTACSSLSSLIIPESVTSIGNNAFAGTGLTSITIPDGVTSIGSVAFQYCSKLASITIPDSVTSIKGGAFNDCTSLTSITIPQAFHSEAEASRLGLDKIWPDGFALPDSSSN